MCSSSRQEPASCPGSPQDQTVKLNRPFPPATALVTCVSPQLPQFCAGQKDEDTAGWHSKQRGILQEKLSWGLA